MKKNPTPKHRTNLHRSLLAASLLAGLVLLAGCESLPLVSSKPDCPLPESKRLDVAFEATKTSLSNGCQAEFDRYFTHLLDLAEGDPKAENKRRFSEFLVWSTDQGLLSKRQATNYYNRYFNTKFVALMGDYNNCASTCPAKNRVLLDMRSELQDKETGLLKVSRDQQGYYQADRLFQETELVLEATCQACAAVR